MAAYIISYDLMKPGQNYQDLHDAIKKYSNWWHWLDSTWIVIDDGPATAIRDNLAQYIDKNDELLVAKLSGEAAWIGFEDQASSWLKKNL